MTKGLRFGLAAAAVAAVMGTALIADAQSPQVALRLLDEQPYDVMFTDIVMPGPMDGTALAREALKRQPQLRVLFASGYSPLLKGGDLPGPILNKPYRKQQLHQALGALLVNS